MHMKKGSRTSHFFEPCVTGFGGLWQQIKTQESGGVDKARKEKVGRVLKGGLFW